MFDLFHHALAASADIGTAMEYIMEVVKKFEQKKQKKKKKIVIFDYKRIQVNPEIKSTGKKVERNQQA